MIKFIKKRDGSIISFDKKRIEDAILKAMNASGQDGITETKKVTDCVVKELFKKYGKNNFPGVENIQDVIETNLILMDYAKAAKAYILYRQERARLRDKKQEIPRHIKKLASKSKKYFHNSLAEFVYYRSYSRWIEEEGRRETWIETVERYMDFMKSHIVKKLSEKEYKEIHQAILKQEIMPSMRLMWSAGNAAQRTHAVAYNCSYIAISKLRDFSETMYLLMCGTGVGFSVEQQTIQKLPQIKRQIAKKKKVFTIEDDKEGWADALYLGLKTWFNGGDVEFDYSKLRPLGARLKTMGGKSSGPDPLKKALNFARERILKRQGRRLTSLDVHDIFCKIGEVVVMGGVRRSALLSLSDLDDEDLRDAKKGMFYLTNPQRSMANNSVAYDKKPTASEFLEEWLALAKSGSGERGIFNREGLKHQIPERRWKKMGNKRFTVGCNPCGEINLRSREFCNLSEVVARPSDTEKSLLRKIKLAVILGTFQSTLTDFSYISKEWEKNCEEERLLGVSITGQWDSLIARNKSTLDKLRKEAINVNKIYAKKFGINQSLAVTCVKPSGTVSQLVDSSSGLHPRYAPYYIRRIRISATDSLFKMLKDQKVPHRPEVGQNYDNATSYIFEFPIKAPENSVFGKDLSAIKQLEHWKIVKENYTEHNPSVTISIKKNEWVEVANWVYENWDIVGGLSFLPCEDYVYSMAPYEEISKETYEEMIDKMPEIDFSQILIYEKHDETQGSKELACAGGKCEIL
ncbi:ribonucleoside-triphosphate reductase [Patescibacteria group bacterium]|nr:ribonucleoside-triphosphate reductase [Patescibacteria group bacterium]